MEPFVAEKLDPVTTGAAVKQLGRTLAHAFVSVATLEAAMELARGVWAITWRTATSISANAGSSFSHRSARHRQ